MIQILGYLFSLIPFLLFTFFFIIGTFTGSMTAESLELYFLVRPFTGVVMFM